MQKKPVNVEFDKIETLVVLETESNQIKCFKDFWKDGELIHSDIQTFDLCVLTFSVAMQMACAYVQSSSLTKYE